MTTLHILRRALAPACFGVLATLPACATAQRAAPMDDGRCGAVAAAIDSLVIGHGPMRAGLVSETTPRHEAEILPGTWKRLREMPGLDSTTLQSFRERNQVAAPSCATLPLVGGMTPITPRDVDALPKHDVEGYWRAFHERFPGVAGITSTSGVGIGAGGRQALLLLDHGCGGLCGFGHIVLLERDDHGTWRVKQAIMTWIS